MVPLALLFLMLLIAAAVMVWSHHSARAAGMSERQPVCAGCLYRLGGWSSPICPECGGDVRVLGVRTGPQTSRIVLSGLVILFSLLVVGPLVGGAMGWLFMQQTGHAHVRYDSESVPNFFVTIETGFNWRRFPPVHDHHTTLIFTRLHDPRPRGNGIWRNGRYFGDTPVPVRIVEFDQQSPLSSASVKDAVEATLAGVADEHTIDSHAQAAERLIALILAAQRQGSINLNMLLRTKSSPLRGTGNGGSGGGSHMHPLGTLPILGSIVICLWLGLRAVRRWCRPGWRLPREGEWSAITQLPQTSFPSVAGAQQDGP